VSPDDARHGSHAGAVKHWRDGETACPACLKASNRLRKSNQLAALRGQPRLVELGETAHRICCTAPRAQLAEHVGMRHERIRRYELAGPTAIVNRRTRDRILTWQPKWTPIGIQRRIQALTLMGWSTAHIADTYGVDMDALKKLRKKDGADIKFVRRPFAAADIAAYDDLHMRIPPQSMSASITRARAADRGWVPALNWNDIDHDPQPVGKVRPGEFEAIVDEAMIDRVLRGGERPRKLTRAEGREVFRRARANGMTTYEIEAAYGLNVERYKDAA
jgi:hypothetical protein